METRKTRLRELNETILQLIDVYQNLTNPDLAIYEDWTAKDILGHLTFWHESFARNVSDLANNIKPTPLKGRYRDLNQRCLDEMRKLPLESILGRLEAAHRVIQANILNDKLAIIPYRKGSRDYTPEEHLYIVNEHIQEHLRGVRKASKT